MIKYLTQATALTAVLAAGAFGMTVAPQTAAAADSESYTVCSDIPWPPFQMGGGGDKAFGFGDDVMRAVAAVEGYDIEIKNMGFDSIIPAIRANKCDIGASGFTQTEKRAKVVDYSDSYYISNQAVVTRTDSDVSFVSDLAGEGENGIIGAQRGTTGAAWAKKNLVKKGMDVEIKRYETYPLAVLDLANGRIDAVIQDAPASQASIASYPDKLTVGGLVKTYEYFGFIAHKGDPKGVLAKINDGLKKLGLSVTQTPAGKQLSVKPKSPWADLSSAYFGPNNETITKAFKACKENILNAESRDDVADYAQCMAKHTE